MNFKDLLINLYVILANAQVMTQDFAKRLNNLHTAILDYDENYSRTAVDF